jgi:hypothetical protein
MKIILTETQYKILNEALGVPEGILDTASDLYEIVANLIKGIDYKKNEYIINQSVDLTISDYQIDSLDLHVNVEHIQGYDGKAELASMGVGQNFSYNRKVQLKVQLLDTEIELHITFVVGNEWEPEDLYERFTRDRVDTESTMAHELKHKYDKQKKQFDLIGKDAEYQTYSKGNLRFGIPEIDYKFMRYNYFMQAAESLVRPTELASRMRQRKILKSKFLNFLKEDRAFKEISEIRDYSFEKLIDGLKEQIDRVDSLLKHINHYDENMSEDEKIKTVLKLVYVNLVNNKVELFDQMTSSPMDNIKSLLNKAFGGLGMHQMTDEEKNLEKVREKFINYLTKYDNDPIMFFKDRCKQLSDDANKIIKKIGKLYAMAEDDQPMNESIINWELHQKLMEKKYGKTKLETEFKFKK